MAADEEQFVLTILLDELTDDIDQISTLNTLALNNAATSAAVGMVLVGEDSDSPIRIAEFAEVTVSLYNDIDFKCHFRMSRTTFQELCKLLATTNIEERYTKLEKKLLATLWTLANQESYRGISDRFGLSKGNLHRLVLHICNKVVSIKGQFIQWPQEHELAEIENAFRQKTNFPGVVGIIDGTHIAIPGPSQNRDSYINRKGYPSIHVQVVCDHQLKFRDSFVGFPGSVHDARVFRNSPLKLHLMNTLPQQYHLIGDTAYPLQHYLLVPYRDNGHLTHIETKFNKVLSSIRADVERSIGLLKCRFRRLKYLHMYLLKDIPTIITATLCFHNFILSMELIDEDDFIASDPDDMCEACGEEAMAPDGQNKRREISCVL